jgi:PPOX class probable F420-dependent enzyme
MPSWPPAIAEEHFAQARIGRLATVTPVGRPHVVPVCFVLHDGMVYTAVDAKPKATSALARLENVRAGGRASVLVDHYEENWANLWWVRVEGAAEVLQSARAIDALVAKYEQYRERRPAGDVWRVATDELRWWRGAG